ncbi:hypothetical protein ACWOAM_09685 [Lactococcus hircilactis]
MNKTKKLITGGLVLLVLLALGGGLRQSSYSGGKISTPDSTVTDLDSSSESRGKKLTQKSLDTGKPKVVTEVKPAAQKEISASVSKSLGKFNEKAIKNDFYIQGKKGYEKVSIEKLETIETKQAISGISLVRDVSDGKMKYLITFKE